MVTKAKNCFDPRTILNGHVPRICKETSLILHNPSSVPGRDLWQRLCSIRGGRSDISEPLPQIDRKSTRLNSSHGYISYAVFCLKKKKINIIFVDPRTTRFSSLQ